MSDLFFANLAKAEKEREAERDRLRSERQFWALDVLPASWDQSRKARYREREVLLNHARNVALPAGRITERQYAALEADIAQQELGDMDMNEYLAATGRARNAHGRVVDIDREAPCHLDLVRARAALESSGDPRADAREAREARNRIVASTGYELNSQGIIDDVQYGALLRTSDAVPADLRDPEGSVLLSDEQLGQEFWAHHFVPEFKPGDMWREEQREAEAKKIAADPLLRERQEAEREMRVSEKFAQDWRKRNEQARLGDTPLGRERLKEQRRAEEVRRDAETLREVASDLAQGTMPTETVRERLAKIAEVRAPDDAEAMRLIKTSRRGEPDPALTTLADALALGDRLAAAPTNANPPITQNHGGQSNG